MKFCELRVALLFSLHLCGVLGRTSFYDGNIPNEDINFDFNRPEERKKAKDLSVNDPQVISLSTFAVKELNQERKGSDNPLLLLDVVKANGQVFSGNLTMLTLKVIQGGVKELCDVKILNEPWANKYELIHSKCETVAARLEPREMITDGGDELDVNNEEVIRLSKVAVDELNKGIVDVGDRNCLLETKKASARALSGKEVNLMLILKISQVHVMKECKVEIQRKIWTNENKIKQIQCSETDEAAASSAPLKKNARGAVNEDSDIVNLNVNDTEVVSMGDLSLIEFNTEKEETDPPLTLSNILKAVLHKHSGKFTLTLNVSQGNTENTCVVDLWENPYTGKLDISHSQCGTLPPSNTTTSKRGEELNVNDPEGIRLSVMALVDLNKRIKKGEDPIGFLEIIKVFRHADSNNSSALILKVFQGRDKRLCYIKIKEDNVPRVIESICEIIKTAEGLDVNDPEVARLKTPEGLDVNDPEVARLKTPEGLDVNDPEVTRLSALAITALNDEKFKGDDPLILSEIIKAIYSSAEKSMLLTLKVSQGRRKHVCNMEFWVLNDSMQIKIKHSKCGTVPAKTTTRRKKSKYMLGKAEILNVNDPEVIRLAMMAVAELYNRQPAEGVVNLLKIVKATRQIVSGHLTTLKFKVSQGSRKKMCNVKIIEQPWLRVTEITEAECKVLYKTRE